MPRYLLARDNGLEEEPGDLDPMSLEAAWEAAETAWLTSSAVLILVYEVTPSGAHNLIASRGFKGWECLGMGLPAELSEVA